MDGQAGGRLEFVVCVAVLLELSFVQFYSVLLGAGIGIGIDIDIMISALSLSCPQ